MACKDFEVNDKILKDFAHLKNSIIDSEQGGYGTDLYDILKTIDEQQILPSYMLKKFFWEMFIGDALVGNFDRHNGNWGFLINRNTGEVDIAPIFDCGSCLYPQIEENSMNYIISNTVEIENRIFTYPTSAIQHEGKKINYAQFLMTTENGDCIDALKTISARIDMREISEIINNTPFISDVYKKFLYTMVMERKEKIIDSALNRIQDTV